MATICTPNVSVSTDSSLQIWRDWTLVWSGIVLGLQNKFYWCHWSDVVKDITRPIITWSEYLRSSLKMVTSTHCFLSSFSKQWTYFLLGSATQNVSAIIEQKSRDELVAAVLHLLDELQNCNKSWTFTYPSYSLCVSWLSRFSLEKWKGLMRSWWGSELIISQSSLTLNKSTTVLKF